MNSFLFPAYLVLMYSLTSTFHSSSFIPISRCTLTFRWYPWGRWLTEALPCRHCGAAESDSASAVFRPWCPASKTRSYAPCPHRLPSRPSCHSAGSAHLYTRIQKQKSDSEIHKPSRFEVSGIILERMCFNVWYLVSLDRMASQGHWLLGHFFSWRWRSERVTWPRKDRRNYHCLLIQYLRWSPFPFHFIETIVVILIYLSTIRLVVRKSRIPNYCALDVIRLIKGLTLQIRNCDFSPELCASFYYNVQNRVLRGPNTTSIPYWLTGWFDSVSYHNSNVYITSLLRTYSTYLSDHGLAFDNDSFLPLVDGRFLLVVP